MTGLTSPDLHPPPRQPPPVQQTVAIPPEAYPGITKLMLRNSELHMVVYRPLPAFAMDPSPWVHVDFYEGAPKHEHVRAEHQFCIWAANGDVYEVQPDGAVGDDPMFTFGR